jgi:hypothetical protein
MRRHRFFTILLLLFPAFAYGQFPDPPSGAGHPDTSVGSYSLLITTLEPSIAAHWLSPPLTLDLDGASPLAPREISGTKTVPSQYVIEGFGNPRYDCIAKISQERGCDALDRSDLTLRDENTVAYHLLGHGEAVQLELNLQVHDLSPVSRTTLEASWHPGDIIFLPVPKPTPSLHFLSAVLVGTWNGNAIVFEPGKPLPDGAKKGLEDLDVHQDLGDKILYSYKVKDPKVAK